MSPVGTVIRQGLRARGQEVLLGGGSIGLMSGRPPDAGLGHNFLRAVSAGRLRLLRSAPLAVCGSLSFLKMTCRQPRTRGRRGVLVAVGLRSAPRGGEKNVDRLLWTRGRWCTRK